MFFDVLKRYITVGIVSFTFVGSLYAQPWRSVDCCQTNECCDSGWFSLDRFSIGAEALWWKTNQDNTAFALKSSDFEAFTSSTVGTTTTDSFFEAEKTKAEELDFKWRTGCRVNVDYLLPCKDWDFGFTWTHYIGKARGHATAPNQEIVTSNTFAEITLSPAFINQVIAVGDFDTIKSRWNLTYNNYEWDIGKTCCCAAGFAFRPYIGVKYLEIKQRFHIDSDAKPYVVSNGTEVITQFDRQVLKSRFSGVGLQGGLDANWLIGCGFSVYSNVSGGIAYGKAHATRKEFHASHTVFTSTTSVTIDDSASAFDNRGHKHVARPNLDFAIGLNWQHYLCDCYLVTVRAGWEYHHYFNQNFFRSYRVDNDLKGDLSFHGFTAGAGVQF